MISFLRRSWPFWLASTIVVLLVCFRAAIVPLVVADRISLDGVYSAVFGWSAIQTGFLFGVFGFIVGKRDGFIGAIGKTIAMKHFASDLRFAIFIGFLLTVTSMPMIAYPVAPKEDGGLYIVISIWFGLFIWAFALFCKVAYEFGLIVRIPDSEDSPAH